MATLDGCPISTDDLWSSTRVNIRFLLTCFYQGPSPLILQFGWTASFRKSCFWPHALRTYCFVLVAFLRSETSDPHSPVSELCKLDLAI